MKMPQTSPYQEHDATDVIAGDDGNGGPSDSVPTKQSDPSVTGSAARKTRRDVL